MIEFYLEMVLVSTSVLITFNWTDDTNDKMNCIYSVIYLTIALISPVVMCWFYWKKKNKLYKLSFRYKYGGGYDGLKEPMTTDGQLGMRKRAYFSSILMPLIFVGRRLIFATSVTIFTAEGGATLLPILGSFWTVWISLEFLIHASPYEKRSDTYKEIFNEVTLLILFCFLLSFTAWMPVVDVDDSDIKTILAWVFVGIVLIFIVTHFVVMILESLKLSCKFTVKTVKKVQEKIELERRATRKITESSIEEPLPPVIEPEPESDISDEPVQRMEFILEAPEIVNMRRDQQSDISKLDTFKQIVS